MAPVGFEDDASPPSPSDRKSTRLNSSHSQISYAVFCLKKKNTPYAAVCHDYPNAERFMGLQLAAQPEHIQYRASARVLALYNDPPCAAVQTHHPDCRHR